MIIRIVEHSIMCQGDRGDSADEANSVIDMHSLLLLI